ncbi:MAG: chemotaxis protein CheW [Gammaproteobacteria bacterium]|jgi:chemosensory pili system protein ChpC
MAQQALKEVYSQLIPIDGGKLIVPRSAVAEVMGYTRPRPSEADRPWLLGNITWNNQDIPLVSFEGMCGLKVPEVTGRARIAVLYSINGRIEPSAFALLTQGYPYLVRVNPGVLSVDEKRQYAAEGPMLTHIRMANERPVIPDIERMEDEIAEALGIPERGEVADAAASDDDADIDPADIEFE